MGCGVPGGEGGLEENSKKHNSRECRKYGPSQGRVKRNGRGDVHHSFAKRVIGTRYAAVVKHGLQGPRGSLERILRNTVLENGTLMGLRWEEFREMGGEMCIIVSRGMEPAVGRGMKTFENCWRRHRLESCPG